MVGGFIQHQQVGALPDHQSQCQTGLLAARERGDGLGGAVPAEVEAAEEVQDVLVPRLRTQALNVQYGAGL